MYMESSTQTDRQHKHTMKLLVCAIAAVVGHTIGVAALAAGPPDGSHVAVSSGEHEVKPGGPRVAVDGNIQQVPAQLLKLKGSGANGTSSTPQRRDQKGDWAGSQFKVRCARSGSSEAAEVARIEKGVAELRGVGGQPKMSAGPGECKTASCSHNSAISWCNNNWANTELPAFSFIAEGAELILKDCKRGPNGSLVKGEVYHKDRNVSVSVLTPPLAMMPFRPSHPACANPSISGDAENALAIELA
ncbi:hypothetical protein O9K51_00404 [Purpureocillium lavendulum]|uniref:Uncharacterized protein n=1 Tax=Purpureocillium lavendulum TaxID=1247861 RepID=A0AB34G316_9HYPO|nr:hypothetical protein O9K51_00404 [Purpureocillium lavendulum]